MKKHTYIVRDYMHETVFLNQRGATLKDVVALMVEKKRNGAFVVDDDNRVVGVISAWDIIQHIVPDYLEEDKHLAPFEAGSVFEDRTSSRKDDSIELFMTKLVHMVHEESTIMEAATTLSEFHIRQLPVVDDDGILQGCINRTDVKLVIADILGISID